MQDEGEHLAGTAVPRKKPPWSGDDGEHLEQRQHEEFEVDGDGGEEERRRKEERTTAQSYPKNYCEYPDTKERSNYRKYDNGVSICTVEEDSDVEDDESNPLSQHSRDTAVDDDCCWVNLNDEGEGEATDEEDEVNTVLLPWGERKRRLAEQSRRDTRDTNREERDRRVRFVEEAVQYHERQRHKQLLSTRFAAVCGAGYKGDGPKLVDSKGRQIKTISDSGTNLDLMSYETAQHLHKCGLVYHKCPDNELKQYVVFGVESAREPIIGYMHGQGLVGKVAVVKNVAANLISVTAFTQRGMIVTYTDKEVQIKRAKNDELVFVGPYDAQTRLYHLDLIHLMLATGQSQREDTQSQYQERQQRISSTGGISFTASEHDETRANASGNMEVEEGSSDEEEEQPLATFSKAALLRGLQFHQNMEHIPYSTIASNIETGTWTGLHKDLTPALMRYMARRRDCVICGISRWNEDHPTGSGDRKYPVGHTVALDYQGKISPISRNGETGEFVLTDLGSGFTRRYGERGDKTTVEAALTDWCSFFLSHRHVVRDARHDSGSVEVGAKFIAAARKLGVNTIPTPPGVPEKRIERRIQTHKNDIAGILARTRLLEARDWDIASTHACLIRSTMSCAASKQQGDGTKSPYELVTGKVPRIDVFQKFGLGDIGVVKKAEANKPGYGGHKNEAVQIVGFEVNDVKAVRVEVVGSRTRLRRGGVKKLFLRSAEMNDKEQAGRQATFKDNAEDESLTFAIEGGGDVVVESVQQLAAQEMDLAKKSASVEEAESVARRVLLRRDMLEKAAEEEAMNREGEENETAQADDEEEEKTQDQRDREESPEGWYWAWPDETVANVGFWTKNEAAQAEEKTQDQRDRDESPEERYWPWPDETVDNFGFWKAYLAVHGMPAESYAGDIFAFTASTGATFEMDYDDEGVEGSGSGNMGGDKSDSSVAGEAFAAKIRPVRDDTNPSQRMINNNETLAEMWRPSMVKERKGIFNTSHEVTEEYAHKFGVTRHVTARSTKRDATLKTRFAIDGRHEINQGKFPNRDALYSPAMDEELLRLSLQCAATLDMELGKSDVEQCFTHNPMETARFKRKLIVYMDEYESGVPGGQYREFDSVSYGTADASSEWYINMSRELMGKAEGMGLTKSVHHPCLFYKGSVAKKDLIMVSVATDDMLRLNLKTAESRKAMVDFKRALDKKWPLKHEDGVDFKEILGVEIERGQQKEVRCTQPAEMRKIREAFFGEWEVPEVMVPLHPEIETAGNEVGGLFDSAMFDSVCSIGDDNDSEEARADRSTQYRSLLGKLGYIRITRIDVLHTLSVLAERAHRPARRDVHGLYWLAAYLLTTEHVPLTFHPVDMEEEAMNGSGVLEWTLFSDCSWASRAGFSASCIAHMAVQGTIRTKEQLERRPFTAPVMVKTGKQTGPAAISAAAGEMIAAVAVLKSNTAVRGMSEELAGVAAPQPSEERMPEGCARPSPLCTDNASNVITINSLTGKKAKGMRMCARSIAFIQYHVDEGSVEVVTVTSEQQRANPLTKAIRSASVHFREAEWLLGTSPELAGMQAMAEERGRSKRSLRPEVLAVASFAGFGILGSKGDFIWAKRATELREMGDLCEEEVDKITRRNTTTNNAPKGGRSFKLWEQISERKPALQEARQTNASARWLNDPNRREEDTSHEGVSNSINDLAALIFRTDEWMREPQQHTAEGEQVSEPPSDDDAAELRQEGGEKRKRSNERRKEKKKCRDETYSSNKRRDCSK